MKVRRTADDTARLRFFRTPGEIAGVLALSGVLAQILSYTSARGFYRLYGLSPEHLGVTPLNAMLKLSTTWLMVVLILVMALAVVGQFLLGLVLREDFRQWRTRRKRKARSPAAKVRKPYMQRGASGRKDPEDKHIFRMVGVLVVMSLLALTGIMAVGGYYLGARAAIDAISGDGRLTGWNVVRDDLLPVRTRMRWVKPEERPEIFYENLTVRYRAPVVDFLGAYGGLTYVWDTNLRRTLIIPTGQVQFIQFVPDGQPAP